MGIVSNKGRRRVASDLEQVGVDLGIFAVLIGAEDTERRKPHPDQPHLSGPV
ncbi:HAD family hydrolase [Leisingera aquaemixtae]|uniref:HAD hydrolase-like protein n=1 Tax=Leisingera aquaemixtae TaxID=1396826 RepID=UPI001C97B832|nr:HAD family hydrolase [Leisingera aquaemixtae]